MTSSDRENLVPDPVTQAAGEQGGPILSAFARTDVDARRGKVNVLDAQRHAFGDAQARTVQNLREKSRHSFKCVEEASDFIDGEHNRKTRQTLYPPKSVQVAHFELKNVPIEEEDRIERLRLR